MTDRRQLLKVLVASGILVPSALAQSQDRAELSTEVLERAAALLDAGLKPSRIRELLPSVQRNVDFFRVIRELEIADEVEPAPIFHADSRRQP